MREGSGEAFFFFGGFACCLLKESVALQFPVFPLFFSSVTRARS